MTAAGAAPAPVEHPWPPLTLADATAYRWAKIAEIEQLDRALSRMTRSNSARPRLLTQRKQLLAQLEAANAWIARRPHEVAAPSVSQFSDPDVEPPAGMRAMTNAEFLIHVQRRARTGYAGPIPRPLVRM